MRIEYQEIDISKVFDHCAEGYELKDGESLYCWRDYYDPAKRILVLKLFILEVEDNGD